MSETQTVAGAYAKIEAHEDLCALRYHNIEQSMSGTKDDINKLFSLAWKALSAIVALLISIVIGLVAVIYVVQVDRPSQAGPMAIAVSPPK